jgi:carbon-monoxide dehydrogenase large subunit
VVHELTFAATKDGDITAVKSEAWCAMGAYLELVAPGIPLLGAWLYSGPYEISNYSVTFTGVFTHTTPTDAYRGAGRPEATYVLERTMDALARELGMDPVELRRKNFVKEFPHTMASGLTIDAGDYEGSLDRLLELLDLDAIRADQAERRGGRKQIGVGFDVQRDVAWPLRASSGHPLRRRRLGRAPSGSIRSAPSRSCGRPARAEPRDDVRAGRGRPLGVDVDDVEVLHGDTAVSQLGMDTYGSRSLAVGGMALYHATQKVVEKARRIVAHQLEVSEEDLEFTNGTFSVKGSPDRAMDIKAVAFQAHAAHDLPDGMEPGLEETAVYDPTTSPGPVEPTLQSLRSTRRRATRASCATSRSTTSETRSTRRSSTDRCTAV